MIAQVLSDRSGRVVGLRVGGFNLLPHRQRRARALRRRRSLECLAAAFVGVAAALIWNAAGVFAEARADRARHRLEAALAELAAPLAQYRQLERSQADRRARSERSRALARSRDALWGIADALSRKPVAGIALERLRLAGHDVELRASAADGAAPAILMERLGQVPGVREAELADLRFLPGVGGRTVAFVARLAVDGSDTDAPALAPPTFVRGRR